LGDWQKQLSAVLRLAERDGRYKEKAYLFVLKALEHSVAKLPERRHVTGRELLDGIRELATATYGPTAPLVLEHWGVGQTLDFGRIVFALVEAGVLSRTDEDSLEDFRSVFDFKEEFVQKYKWGAVAADE
jgi:uncharacterized repeat protein (TIGR04138 family)